MKHLIEAIVALKGFTQAKFCKALALPSPGRGKKSADVVRNGLTQRRMIPTAQDALAIAKAIVKPEEVAEALNVLVLAQAKDTLDEEGDAAPAATSAAKEAPAKKRREGSTSPMTAPKKSIQMSLSDFLKH